MEGEIESLQSILNPQELKILDLEFLQKSDEKLGRLQQLIKLSIVPNFEHKIYCRDNVKKLDVELRKLPALEVVIGLTPAYPSN